MEETLDNIFDDKSADDDLSADSEDPKPGSSGKVPSADNDDTEDSLMLVPQELVEEEKKVREDNQKMEEQKLHEGVAAVKPDEEHYERLQELLDTSQIYSDCIRSGIEEARAVLAKSAAKQKQEEASDQVGALETPSSPQPGPSGMASGTKTKRRRSSASDEPGDWPTKKAKPATQRTFKGEKIPDDQPLLLSGGLLRDYQIKGYQWVVSLFQNGVNGILADEMGLGKTMQVIALLSHFVEKDIPGPFLIVAPLSTVPNWIAEFEKFAPLMPTVLYHGTKAEREVLRRRNLRQIIHIPELGKPAKNVFVTSFEIAMNDRPYLAKTLWKFMVVDEGHRLKNLNCKLLKELVQYRSTNKLLLTGTPLQNSLAELWSLLHFTMPAVFDNQKAFESWFDAKEIVDNASESARILRQERENQILAKLHSILQPFLLRRMKSDVDLKIPPKKEILVFCPMSSKQRELYEKTINRTMDDYGNDKENSAKYDSPRGRGCRRKSTVDYKFLLDTTNVSDKKLEEYVTQLNKYHKEREQRQAVNAYSEDKANRTSEIRVSLRNRLMDLRKSTNHPYLIDYPLTADGCHYDITPKMIDVSGKLKVLDQMLVRLVERDHKVLLFSQMTRMLDILGDYLTLKDFKYSRIDGTMPFTERQLNIDSFNTDPEVRIFLLSTRAGGLGINLTAADTCIIYDSDWNPQQDLQAQDRCHRIGQTKPVMVFRLVTANTIDQKMVERAAAKRKLEKMIIHSKKFKSHDNRNSLKREMEAISAQELLDLLNSQDHQGVVDRGTEAVFSEKELDALLDRSDMLTADGEKSKKHKKTRGGQTKGAFLVIEKEASEPVGLPSIKGD